MNENKYIGFDLEYIANRPGFCQTLQVTTTKTIPNNKNKMIINVENSNEIFYKIFYNPLILKIGMGFAHDLKLLRKQYLYLQWFQFIIKTYFELENYYIFRRLKSRQNLFKINDIKHQECYHNHRKHSANAKHYFRDQIVSFNSTSHCILVESIDIKVTAFSTTSRSGKIDVDDDTDDTDDANEIRAANPLDAFAEDVILQEDQIDNFLSQNKAYQNLKIARSLPATTALSGDKIAESSDNSTKEESYDEYDNDNRMLKDFYTSGIILYDFSDAYAHSTFRDGFSGEYRGVFTYGMIDIYTILFKKMEKML